MPSKGFTAIELLIVCLIITLVAAIAIPNYRTSQDRAREGRVKSNMHVFQLATEDLSLRGDSGYATRAANVAPYLSEDFPNPFDRMRGENGAWEDRASMSGPPSPHPGIVSYADTLNGLDYTIKGYGRKRALAIVLRGTLADYGPPPPEREETIQDKRRGGSKPGSPKTLNEAKPDSAPARAPAGGRPSPDATAAKAVKKATGAAPAAAPAAPDSAVVTPARR
jgi:prepilin-type N-terminal cleavage/methylation domain-containing protein